MITKKFGVDFFSEPGALTLEVHEVSENPHALGSHTRFHADGWSIHGFIKEDYYTWVSDFFAVHPEHGRVWGNFEKEVYADSEEGFQHFFVNHPPKAWDYGDI